jgi:hypothetical protein
MKFDKNFPRTTISSLSGLISAKRRDGNEKPKAVKTFLFRVPHSK